MLPEFIKESDFWGSIFAIAAFGLLLLAAVVVQVIFQLIIKHRINMSQSAALNTGISYSKYESLIILDGDLPIPSRLKW